VRVATRHSEATQATGTRVKLAMTRSRIFARLACFALAMALSSAAFAQAIVVGAKEFTEQLLVAEMTTQLLRANGFAAHKGTSAVAAASAADRGRGRGRRSRPPQLDVNARCGGLG
jgi:hypothetical protein